MGPEEPDISHLQIDSPDSMLCLFSEKQQQLLIESLYTSLGRELCPFVALAKVGLFASPEHAPLVPDVMVSFQKSPRGPLTQKKNNTYLIWNYGSPPDIVIEIVSHTEGGEDGAKLQKYAEWRVGHYIIFDPFAYLGNRPLRAFQLRGTRYVEMLDPSKLLDFGLGLEIRPGLFRGFEGPWLRILDQDGKLLLTGLEKAQQERLLTEEAKIRVEEERARADFERERAEKERHRADDERARAVEANARAEKLEQELNELRR